MTLRRILFIGPLWNGSTCVPRASALEQLGLEVTALDSTGAYGRTLLEKRVGHRSFITPAAFRMNSKVRCAAQDLRPDVVWIEKGNWLHLSTLRLLKRTARYLVHYNTDDLFCRVNYFWLTQVGMRYFDLYATTNRHNVEEIPRRYAVATLRVGMGFDRTVHSNSNEPKRDRGTIVFVGHREPHTEEYVTALLNAGLPVRVWGHQWHRSRSTTLRQARVLPQEDYVSTIRDASLALCSLSRRNRNESTGRSFEIPAVGTCMLAERTPEHEYLYRDRREALLFSSAEELVSKAKYYLAHEGERETIALAGHNRALRLDLSWQGHVTREWPIMEQMLLSSRGPRPGVDDLPFWPGFRKGEPYAGEEPTFRTTEAAS